MSRDVRNPILASAACALLLVPLAWLAYKVGPSMRVDRSILVRLGEHRGGAHEVASVIAHLADPLPLIAMLAAVLVFGIAVRRPRETVAALVVVAGANLTTQVLKHLLQHSRFDINYGLFQPLSEAFPSGHTTAAASLAAALVLVAPPRLRSLAVAIAVTFTAAVGVSVVVVQWHYPSDVLGGLLVVASWTFAAIAALRWIGPRRRDSAASDGERSSGRFAVSLQ
jgi:membrane-associated phospholipid phosphatase